MLIHSQCIYMTLFDAVLLFVLTILADKRKASILLDFEQGMRESNSNERTGGRLRNAYFTRKIGCCVVSDFD